MISDDLERRFRKITALMMQCACPCIHTRPFLTCTAAKSRMPQVSNPCFSRYLGCVAVRAPGLRTKTTPCCPLTTCSQAHAKTLLNSLSQIINSVPKTNPRCLYVIPGPSFCSSTIPLPGNAPRETYLLCLPGKATWTRICVIASIASKGTLVTAVLEANVHGSKVPDFAFQSGFSFP